MRVTTLLTILPVLLYPGVSAAPSFHIPSAGELVSSAFSSAQEWVSGAFAQGKAAIDDAQYSIDQLKSDKVTVQGIDCELMSFFLGSSSFLDTALEHPAFPQHRLRVVKPTLCDPSVKQLSGYLDISETRHLFFWFEESRNKPDEDPLVLW